jgi:hypothetical protein
MALTAPQVQLTGGSPDRLVMAVSNLDPVAARYLALDAVVKARQAMPRVSGNTAARLRPLYGRNYFGVYFPDAHVWFMEHGTAPRTMTSLAGKVIPMWITDEDGQERAKNPKAKVRSTEDGRIQVLIFRRAAKPGQRKTVRSADGSTRTVPASYPGAPGRIGQRPGRVAGRIAAGNVGVRWRHPGLTALQFLNGALATAAFESGRIIEPVYAADAGTWAQVANRKR